MKLNKEYLHFKRWYANYKKLFIHSQFTNEQIAYSSFKEGFNCCKSYKNENYKDSHTENN